MRNHIHKEKQPKKIHTQKDIIYIHTDTQTHIQ